MRNKKKPICLRSIFYKVGQSQTSLTIDWRKPRDNGGAILSYNIDVSGRKLLSYVPEILDSDNPDTIDDVDTLTYTVSNLEPNTQYRYVIKSLSVLALQFATQTFIFGKNCNMASSIDAWPKPNYLK